MLQGIGFKSKLTIIYKIEKEQRNKSFYSVPKLYASLVLEKNCSILIHAKIPIDLNKH